MGQFLLQRTQDFQLRSCSVAKLELVSVIRHSCPSHPPTPHLPGLSPKMTVRDSQIHPLCLRVVLGRKVPRIETHLRHPEETQTQKAGGPGSHPGFPSWCFYIFLETQSMLLPSILQLTHELHRHRVLNPKSYMPFLLLHQISLD